MKFKPDDQIFGKGNIAIQCGATLQDGPLEVVSLWRGGNSLALCCLSISRTRTSPEEAVFHFPRRPEGLSWPNVLKASTRVVDDIFSGKVEKEGGHGSVEWAVAWFGGDDGFISSYCNTIPTPLMAAPMKWGSARRSPGR